MKTRLKQMGVRDILDNTFSILRENFWSFQGVIFKAFLPSLVIFLLGAIIVAIYLIIVGSISQIPFSDQRFWSELFHSSLISTILVILLLVIIIAAWIIALIIGSIYYVYGNLQIFKAGLHLEKINSKQAFAGIKDKRVRIFLIQFLILAIFYLIAIPGMIISIIVNFISPLAGNLISFGNNILQLIISFFFYLTLPVAIFENQDVIKSISRAFKLMSKKRWRIFWTLLLVYLLGYALGMIIMGLISIPIIIAIMAKQIIIYALAVLFGVAGLLVFNILLSYYYGPMAAIYYDLMIRKEGYDIQLQLSTPETPETGLTI